MDARGDFFFNLHGGISDVVEPVSFVMPRLDEDDYLRIVDISNSRGLHCSFRFTPNMPPDVVIYR